jgi:hypothetical protein
MLTLLLCGSCGGSSSETPPPLEPDPKRLAAEAPAAEEPVPAAPAATTPAPGAGTGNVEDGAEFGIEPFGTRSPPANGGSRRQTWGASPATKTKRPPPHTP